MKTSVEVMLWDLAVEELEQIEQEAADAGRSVESYVVEGVREGLRRAIAQRERVRVAERQIVTQEEREAIVRNSEAWAREYGRKQEQRRQAHERNLMKWRAGVKVWG